MMMAATTGRPGKLSSRRIGGAIIHTYTGGEDGFLVNTHVVEGPSRLVVLDTQFLRRYAQEAADFIEAIGKPIARIIISELHIDHWCCGSVFHERFPDAPISALEGVRNFIRDQGQARIEARRQTLGESIPERAFVPTHVLTEGEETIDTIRFRFERAIDAESAGALITTLPDARAVFPIDIVYQSNFPAVIVPLDLPAGREPISVRETLANWIDLVRDLGARCKDIDLALLGHGPPLDQDDFRKACAATVSYLEKASAVLVEATTALDFASRMKFEFADREPKGWIDLSARQLFAVGRPFWM